MAFRGMRRLYGLLLALLAGLPGCMPRLGDSDAALALEDIMAAGHHSRLKSATPTPLRRAVHYDIEGRGYDGDLYLPGEAVRAGIVLVPGVVAAGKDDARLVALATTLARLQFAVLVPDLRGLRQYQVRAGNVREVADAFRYLVSLPGLVPQSRAGVAGFSYGAGPVLLAALQPDIHEQVRFVLTLGGYYDLRSIVGYFTTGFYREPGDGGWRYQRPNAYIKWVFTLSNADLLENAGDRAALQALAEQARSGSSTAAPVPETLHPDAQALYALLSNEDPHQVPALIEQLPPRIREELSGIDPASRDLSQLRARAILVHGRSDTMIPYTESVALADALPPEQVQLFLIEGFAHVDVQPQRSDIPQLLAAMQALLAQRMPAVPEARNAAEPP